MKRCRSHVDTSNSDNKLIPNVDRSRSVSFFRVVLPHLGGVVRYLRVYILDAPYAFLCLALSLTSLAGWQVSMDSSVLFTLLDVRASTVGSIHTALVVLPEPVKWFFCVFKEGAGDVKFTLTANFVGNQLPCGLLGNCKDCMDRAECGYVYRSLPVRPSWVSSYSDL
jgi:hypothetical protein